MLMIYFILVLMWKGLYNFHLEIWGDGSEGIERDSRNGAVGLAPLSKQEMSTVWIVCFFARVFVRLQGARGAWASPDGS